jgi:hypothetical protein
MVDSQLTAFTERRVLALDDGGYQVDGARFGVRRHERLMVAWFAERMLRGAASNREM